MKLKLKRALSLSLIMCFMFCSVAYAEYATFAGDALARLDVEISGGSGRCLVATYRGTGHTYASYQLVTTDEDGSENSYFTNLIEGTATNINDRYWENGVEDYVSYHAVYKSNTEQVGFKEMPE